MSQPGACPVEDSFGPWAGESCRGGFDFTLLFEESILAIPVHALFLLAIPVRVMILAKANTKVSTSLQRFVKAGFCGVLVILSAALLGLWANGNSIIAHTRATIPTAALTFVASLALCLLSWLEYERSVRPSFLVFIYLFFSTLLDLARVRTLWMMGIGRTIPVVFTCSLALRAVMLVLESTEKRSFLQQPYQNLSKETTSSTISRSVFFWLTPLFRQGYRKILSLDDLDTLDDQLVSEPLGEALARAWAKVPNKSASGALFNTWLKTFARTALSPVIPKLFHSAFSYAQPFLIKAAIDLAIRPQVQPYNNIGYGLIGAYAIVYLGIAIATGQYQWRLYRAATIMRGSVVSLIYQKALRLDLASPSGSSEGALTLVSTDAEVIISGIIHLHELWASLVEIAVGSYLIYREAGASCAMPLALAVVVMIATVSVAIPTGTAHAAWNQASQDRVTATSKTLGSIKWLKISGLSDYAFSVIRNLRVRELKVSKRCRRLLGTALILVVAVPTWAPILTLITFAGLSAGGNDTLTISKAFTLNALFILVNQPLAELIIALPMLASSLASFHRIQSFLNAKERSDNRLTASDEKSEGENPTFTPEKGLDLIASVQGQFRWEEESDPVLDITEWKVQRRDFILLLGPVGCGKSTLLKALLGELPAFQGTVTTNYAGVAYCSQSPWLPNETVRNVITGHTDFDEVWYDRVIEACALSRDISEWPNGDSTMAGTRGISMSGGQKHRLSIARALYARRELLILDDVFSGLDSKTEEIVFQTLFGSQGLLRTGNLTAVVASSDSRRAPYADKVIVLNSRGQIEETGNPEELKLKFNNEELRKTEKSETDDAAAQIEPATLQLSKTEIEAVKTSTDITRQVGNRAVYKFYANAVGWTSLIIFVVALCGYAFFSSFPNIWLKWWGEANEVTPNEDLGKWLGVYVVLGLGAMISILLGTWQLFITIINHSGVYFHDLLSKTTSRAPLSFHAATDSGTTVNRFSQDLSLIDMELPIAAFGVAIGVSFGIASFVMISVSSRYMAIFLPFLLVIFYAVQHFYLRTSRQLRLLDIEHKAPLYTQLIQTIDGLSTIRAFKWEGRFEAENMSLLNDSQRPNYLLYCVQRWLTLVIDLIIAVIAVILIVLVTTLREQIGPGFMGIALSNILGLSATVQATLVSWVALEVALGAVARVRQFSVNTKPEDETDKDVIDLESQDWPTKGEIEIHGLSASYPSSGTVLHDITLSIQPGQKVAICGRTGSGKSSLLLSLLRLIDQPAGTITIDGVDLSTIPREELRSRLVAVPQESYIFDGSVRLNIDPSSTVPDEEIEEALRSVQLLSKIEARGGLDAVIHDGFFSQGESQLFCFARAMLRRSKVLILDEFASSLDNETSGIIHQVLRTSFEGWTVIAIAHKLEHIVDFDKVAVLEGGRLIEFDEPRALLGQNSIFKDLHDGSSKTG